MTIPHRTGDTRRSRLERSFAPGCLACADLLERLSQIPQCSNTSQSVRVVASRLVAERNQDRPAAEAVAGKAGQTPKARKKGGPGTDTEQRDGRHVKAN